MKLNYHEGTWFAVPLRSDGFAVGVVARASKEGRVILCYFFGPCRDQLPKLEDVKHANHSEAIIAHRVGDLGLTSGEWPVIGHSESWDRSKWPVPVFIRRDPLRPLAWRVYRSNDDPNIIIREEATPLEENSLERDSVLGSGAAETVLTKLLG